MNKLQFETSPYLQQHAHNPVDWFPWGDAAFEKAQKEQKPVLVSIGYAACHWCHVMERESFENEEVAAFMNAFFVCVKVDREERPDVDHLYMDALQAMSGQGGWPLNMFVTPDRKPFYGGTYFPPQRAYQRASWMEVLEAVNLTWKKNRDDVEQQSTQLLQHLQQINLQESGADVLPNTKADFETIAQTLLEQADDMHGGFGLPPKFLQTMSLNFLMQMYSSTGNENWIQHALLTIDKMLAGGIYDQIGGGISRYSTDAAWLVPHFEKMLYDNALFLDSLSEAYLHTQSSKYSDVIAQIIQFCIRELSINAAGIGFYAAIDADSEGVEGKYYVWTKAEIKAALPNVDENILKYWDVTEFGNWEGNTILNYSEIDANLENEILQSDPDFYAKLNAVREQLFAIRESRIRPLTDKKVLLSWNALMVTALVKCGVALNNSYWKQLAKDNLDFLFEVFYKDGNWYHNYNQEKVNIIATLEDIAYLIKALLMAGTQFEDYNYILKANALMEFADAHFSDEQNVFYYFSNKTQKDIVIRKIETYDGAQPSVNAIMAENNILLSHWFDDINRLSRSRSLLQAMQVKAKRYPGSFAYWNTVLLRNAKQQTLVVTSDATTTNLNDDLGKNAPFLLIAYKTPFTQDFPIPILDQKQQSHLETYYYCSQNVCQAPTNDLKSVVSKIKMDKMLE